MYNYKFIYGYDKIVQSIITWLREIWLTSYIALFWNFPLFCNFPLMICNFPLFSFFLKKYIRMFFYYSNMKLTTSECFDIRFYCSYWIYLFEKNGVENWADSKSSYYDKDLKNVFRGCTVNFLNIWKLTERYACDLIMWVFSNL